MMVMYHMMYHVARPRRPTRRLLMTVGRGMIQRMQRLEGHVLCILWPHVIIAMIVVINSTRTVNLVVSMTSTIVKTRLRTRAVVNIISIPQI